MSAQTLRLSTLQSGERYTLGVIFHDAKQGLMRDLFDLDPVDSENVAFGGDAVVLRGFAKSQPIHRPCAELPGRRPRKMFSERSADNIIGIRWRLSAPTRSRN